MRIWGIILAGGKGSRFGEKKQFIRLFGKPLYLFSLEVFASEKKIEGLVVVVPGEDRNRVEKQISEFPKDIIVVEGGAERWESSKKGVFSVPDSATHVLIHDAARPLASKSLIELVIKELENGEEAVIPVVPIEDAVKHVEGRFVLKTLKREKLVRAQTPQGFLLESIKNAFNLAKKDERIYDDSQLVERMGGKVKVIPGDPFNIKITSKRDLALAEALLVDRKMHIV